MFDIHKFILNINGLIYDFISYLYNIFMFLAKTNIFSTEDYNNIVTRLYVILGIVMMFILAYSLLKAVINPDEASKGDKSIAKLAQNVVVSLVIITLLPAVFSFTFNFQNTLLNFDTIPKLILGDTYGDAEDENGGRMMAYYVYRAFLYPDPDSCDPNGTVADCENNIAGFREVDDKVKIEKKSFGHYAEIGNKVGDELSYNWFGSIAAGIFLAYVLLNFCFDMGLRVIKLAFYQIIAPIPVICRILPGGTFKDTFDKWVKQVISLFLEVFIRIGAMILGVFFIKLIVTKWNDGIPGISTLNIVSGMIVVALVIMSVVIFIRKLPELLGKLFNLDTGGMKLGIMDKLAQGGVFAAGATVAAGGTQLIRNGFNQFKQSTAEGHGKLRSGLSALKSAVAGGGSAAFRSGYGALKAKNFSDMNASIKKGTAAAGAKKAKRDAYRADKKGAGIVETYVNVFEGHVADTVKGVGEYFGFGSGIEDLQKEQAVYQEGMGFKKRLFDLVSDNENVLAYQGLKKTAQEKDISEYVKKIESTTLAGYTKDNTGYYKDVLGHKVYYKDSDGNIVSDLTPEAIKQKTAEIKKYDNAIKLASLKAIRDKKDDDRVKAEFEAFKVWKKQNANFESVAKAGNLEQLTDDQYKAIDKALSSNRQADIDLLLDTFDGKSTALNSLGIGQLNIMKNDKTFKEQSGKVQVEISRKVQEKKEKEGK